MITQKLVKELFEYRDGELYWKVSNSNRVKIGDKAGSYNSEGYRQTRINEVKVLNHRIIFLMFHGFLPDYIDHINGIQADNRIENLRETSLSQNSCNSKKPNTNTSGIKGVSWHKKHEKWQVQLRINGKAKHFGCYHDIQVAKFIAETMRNKYHQQFSRSN